MKIFLLSMMIAAFCHCACSAFQQPMPCQPLLSTRHTSLFVPLAMSGDGPGDVAAEAADDEPPVIEELATPKVLCPDCDLCDGSGR